MMKGILGGVSRPSRCRWRAMRFARRHLLGRDTPPKMTFIIDELALYR